MVLLLTFGWFLQNTAMPCLLDSTILVEEARHRKSFQIPYEHHHVMTIITLTSPLLHQSVADGHHDCLSSIVHSQFLYYAMNVRFYGSFGQM